MTFNPFKLRKQLKTLQEDLKISENLNDQLIERLTTVPAVKKADIQGNKQYYIVTISSYQLVNGSKLLKGKADKPLQEAFNKGFIFDTEEKAKEVYNRIMAIKG